MLNWESNSAKNEITGTQTSFSINFGGELSFIPSFISPERLHCCYIYFHRFHLYTIIIFTLKPCALSSEFWHFKLLLLYTRLQGAGSNQIGYSYWSKFILVSRPLDKGSGQRQIKSWFSLNGTILKGKSIGPDQKQKFNVIWS